MGGGNDSVTEIGADYDWSLCPTNTGDSFYTNRSLWPENALKSHKTKLTGRLRAFGVK